MNCWRDLNIHYTEDKEGWRKIRCYITHIWCYLCSVCCLRPSLLKIGLLLLKDSGSSKRLKIHGGPLPSNDNNFNEMPVEKGTPRCQKASSQLTFTFQTIKRMAKWTIPLFSVSSGDPILYQIVDRLFWEVCGAFNTQISLVSVIPKRNTFWLEDILHFLPIIQKLSK